MKLKDPVICTIYDSNVRAINNPGIFMNIHDQYEELSSESELDEEEDGKLPKKKCKKILNLFVSFKLRCKRIFFKHSPL